MWKKTQKIIQKIDRSCETHNIGVEHGKNGFHVNPKKNTSKYSV